MFVVSLFGSTISREIKGFNKVLNPREIVNLIEANINQKEIKIKIANTKSQPVRMTTGLRQGDTLFRVLFNLLLKKIVQEMNVSEGIAIGQIKI